MSLAPRILCGAEVPRMRAALYLRRSTNEVLQPDSLDAQEDILRVYAATNAMEVVATYADNSSGRSVRGRTSFLRLVNDVRKDRAFEVVLVRDVSRWGRFANIDEAAYWEFVFLLHGVRILYVQEAFGGDENSPYGDIMKSLRRMAAAEFSAEKSRLVQFGKYRAAKAGFYIGGDAPYGMTRVLVTKHGEPIQHLRPGERKALADHRIKLDVGDSEPAEVVRKIYHLCADENLDSVAISRALNKEGIPSPQGGTWQGAVIRKILTNPAYIGTSAAHFRASANFKAPQAVETRNAWPALVSAAVWERAQTQFTRRRSRRSPAGLATQLREVFEAHGIIAAGPALGEVGRPTADTYRKYFERGDNEAIALAFADELSLLRRTIFAELATSFRIEENGVTATLNGVLSVGVLAAFPRSHHLGRVHWRFDFSGEETEDVTIGIALSPEAQPAFYFRFPTVLRRGKRHSMTRHMYSDTTKSATRSLEQVARALRRDLLRFSRVAAGLFLCKVEGLFAVNAREVARTLGWPEDSGLSMYHKLRKAGVKLPPLKRQIPAHRLTLVCDDCGKERIMLASAAMQHDSSLCAVCCRQRKKRFSTCPDCGITRPLGHGEFRRLSNGANSRCRSCNARARALLRNATNPAAREGASGRFKKRQHKRE